MFARMHGKGLGAFFQHVTLHPGEERIALARDGVPCLVEAVVARVIALRIGRKRAARNLDDVANRPVRQYHRIEAAAPEIIHDLLHRHHRTFGGEHGFLLHAEHALDQHIAGSVGALGVDHRHVRPVRRYRRQLLAGERAGHPLDLGIHLRQVAADIAAENGARQPGRAGLIGIGHGGVRMLFQFQLLRPAVFHGIAESMQRADARIATP